MLKRFERLSAMTDKELGFLPAQVDPGTVRRLFDTNDHLDAERRRKPLQEIHDRACEIFIHGATPSSTCCVRTASRFTRRGLGLSATNALHAPLGGGPYRADVGRSQQTVRQVL